MIMMKMMIAVADPGMCGPGGRTPPPSIDQKLRLVVAARTGLGPLKMQDLDNAGPEK